MEKRNIETNPEPEKKENPILNVVKGITLGISAAIPGLSAGTIAIVERCYDPIIHAVSDLKKSFKKNVLLLLPYVIGLILGALAALIGIQRGYQAAPFTLTSLFAGLVIGSLPVAISELRKGKTAFEKLHHILPFILCLLIAAGLGLITALCKVDLEAYLRAREWWMYLFIVFAGFLAAGACIVPGISGSMSLMVIGMYLPVLNTYTGNDSIFHSGDTITIVTGLILALLLVIGALVGILVSSKAMNSLLTKHRVSTFYGILGLILGSIFSMFMNSTMYPKYTEGSIKTWDYIVGSVLLVLAMIGMFFFCRYTEKKKKEA